MYITRAQLLAVSVIMALTVFVLPAHVFAQVVINEIAWMGTANSSNDEWIELYNAGTSTAALDGWVLQADDGSPSISLSGIIDPDAYYLLERTDDDTVPELAADLIYSGDLSNSLEVLRLTNASGTVVDFVDFWYAGDADTRATMERNDPVLPGNDSTNWHTHVFADDDSGIGGTPGAPNSGLEEQPQQQEQSIATTTQTIDDSVDTGNVGDSVPESAQSKQVKIFTLIYGTQRDADEITVAQNQAIHLRAGGDIPGNYRWNWGNGVIENAPETIVSYEFPGSYLLTLTGQFSDENVTDQLKVVVYPNGVIISEFQPNPVGADGDDEWIELGNTGDTLIDIGGFMLDDGEDGSRPFIIPDRTYIFPRGFLVFKKSVTKLNLNNTDDQVRLLTSDGVELASVEYGESREGFSVAYMGNEGYVWTSKPTPGAGNVVNPNNATIEIITSADDGALREMAVQGGTSADILSIPLANTADTLAQMQQNATGSLIITQEYASANDPRDRLVFVEKSQQISHTGIVTGIALARESTTTMAVRESDSNSSNDNSPADPLITRQKAGVSFIIVGLLMIGLVGFGFFRRFVKQLNDKQLLNSIKKSRH